MSRNTGVGGLGSLWEGLIEFHFKKFMSYFTWSSKSRTLATVTTQSFTAINLNGLIKKYIYNNRGLNIWCILLTFVFFLLLISKRHMCNNQFINRFWIYWIWVCIYTGTLWHYYILCNQPPNPTSNPQYILKMIGRIVTRESNPNSTTYIIFVYDFVKM